MAINLTDLSEKINMESETFPHQTKYSVWSIDSWNPDIFTFPSTVPGAETQWG